MGDGGAISASEVPGSGMHFPVADLWPQLSVLHPSLHVWPLKLHPHVWFTGAFWHVLPHDLWVLNSSSMLAQDHFAACFVAFLLSSIYFRLKIPSWSRILPSLAWLILLPLEVPSVRTGVQTVCQLLFIVTTCLMFSLFLEHQSLLQKISIACQRLLPIKGVSSLGGLDRGCSWSLCPCLFFHFLTLTLPAPWHHPSFP